MTVLSGGAARLYQPSVSRVLEAVCGSVVDFDGFLATQKSRDREGAPTQQAKNAIVLSSAEEPWGAFQTYLDAAPEGAETNILAFYLPAKAGIAHYLEAGLLPDQAKFAWVTTTRSLLDFARAQRGRVALVDTKAALLFPDAFMEFCVNRYRFNGAGTFDDALELPEIDPLNSLLGAQMAQQDWDVDALQQELDARSETVAPFLPPDNFDLQAVYVRLAKTAEDFQAARDALSKTKAQGQVDAERIDNLQHRCSELEAEVQRLQAGFDDMNALADSHERLSKKVPLLNESLRVMQLELDEAYAQAATGNKDLEARSNMTKAKAEALEKEKARLLAELEAAAEKERGLNRELEARSNSSKAEADAFAKEKARLLAEIDAERDASANTISKLDAENRRRAQSEAALTKRVQGLEDSIETEKSARHAMEKSLERATIKDGLYSEQLEDVQANAEAMLEDYLRTTEELEELKKVMKWREDRSARSVAVLEKELAEAQARVEKFETSTSWKFTKPLRSFLRMSGLARKESPKEELRRIKASGYFDARWYAKTYPDVVGASITPLEHYYKFGAREGRSPGPRFNTRQYTNDNPEVLASGVNPLLHFLNSQAV